ncbi:universal stress protein UspE [Colwellia sp. BRX8-9]|jgi:universal stress protein E|uniref:universal stress protein UspE n=1 Tax=Colwellia sp. BRX8-9 TaxID=2759831 RepID=UPI0015F37EEA|nr:universal stress protein UspE [Colwellia sp. BRX8-9]MBA6349097.1 universal stress protein UspE [Colwellia sp. BRX8-9]
MDKYKKILAVIDPTTENQKALKRAIELARHSGGQITAFLTIYDLSYEMTTMLSGEEREAMRQSVINDRKLWLDEKISETDHQDITIDTCIIWHNRPFEKIIKKVLAENFDIVIKGTHQHDKLKSVIFTPTDWHILRKCPCPVLLVKDHSWPSNGNLLTALNIGSDDDEHKALNNKLTQESIVFSSLIKANVHLVNSYPGTPVNIAIEIPEFNASEYNDTMFNHHKSAMKDHANSFNIPLKNTHVKEGLPEDVIQSISKHVDAELVVLGTIGRTGISAALIGNTAEHVIDRLNCDVLAIKPDGYLSPLA